jgi:transposase
MFYSRFCELYGHWRRKQDVVLRQEHKPGEKGLVDWAGATLPLHDPISGEVRPASLFVMVLGASSYTYAEATLDQQLTSWLNAHIHAFEYFGGVPKLLVPDKPRTGVSRACRYDSDLNPTYQEMAMHYGFGVVPARPYRPRDIFRLEDLNRAIWELLERLNQRPFKKRTGSRASIFAEIERSALQTLPAERFDMSQWSRARVNIDYHVVFDTNFYSVPYNLVHELVEIRATPTTVELFHKGQRVASHPRGHGRERVFTQKGHCPRSHQAHLEWTPSHGALGRADRTEHRPAIRTYPLGEAPSGDGLWLLSGHHPARGGVLGNAHGSVRRSCPENRCLPLQEREIDPQEVTRSATAQPTAFAASSATARQHPLRRVLRVVAGQKAVEKTGKERPWKSLRDFHFSHTFNNNKLDDPDHFLENATASVASLRRLIGSTRNTDRDQIGMLIGFEHLVFFHPFRPFRPITACRKISSTE